MIVMAYNGDNGIGCANSDGDLLQPVRHTGSRHLEFLHVDRKSVSPH